MGKGFERFDPHPPRSPFSLVREEGEGKVLDGVETSVWTAVKDSIEFPLSRLTGEGARG